MPTTRPKTSPVRQAKALPRKNAGRAPANDVGGTRSGGARVDLKVALSEQTEALGTPQAGLAVAPNVDPLPVLEPIEWFLVNGLLPQEVTARCMAATDDTQRAVVAKLVAFRGQIGAERLAALEPEKKEEVRRWLSGQIDELLVATEGARVEPYKPEAEAADSTVTAPNDGDLASEAGWTASIGSTATAAASTTSSLMAADGVTPTSDAESAEGQPVTGLEVATTVLAPSDAAVAERQLVACCSFRERTVAIKQRVDALEVAIAGIIREVLAIADMIADAQLAHAAARKTTPESIPGSFVKAMAHALGKSDGFVEKYLRVSRIEPEKRALIEAHPRIASDLTAVLDVARAADIEGAEALVLTYEQGGRPAHNALVASSAALAEAAKADAGLRNVLKQFVDGKVALGGLNPELPVPPELVARHPILTDFATVGDLRRAFLASKKRKVSTRSASHESHIDSGKVVRLAELAVTDPQVAHALAEQLLPASRVLFPDANPATKVLYLEDGTRGVEIPEFANLGELRKAVSAAGLTNLADGEARHAREHHRLGVTGALVQLRLGESENALLRCGNHQLRVHRVIISREALEMALAGTKHDGPDNDALMRHRHPPIADAIVLVRIN